MSTLKQLPMTVGSSLPTTRSTAVAAGTTAVGGTQPRLVGRSPAKEMNAVVPGMGDVVVKHGFGKSTKMLALIRNNPGKATLVGIAGALGVSALYDEAVELANSSPVAAVRDWAVSVVTGTDELRAEAGVGDPTPDEDGTVGQTSIEQIRIHSALVDEARAIFKRAASAAGSPSHLRALDEWRAIDDDIKQIIWDTYDR